MVVILMLVSVSTHATDPDALRLVERDKARCNEAADERVGMWILNMSEWNENYYNCLLGKLKALEPKYLANALEAQRLEALCPESTLNGPVTELSLMGITLAKQLSERERQKSGASHSIEQTLELYYDRTIQSRNRIRELRR